MPRRCTDIVDSTSSSWSIGGTGRAKDLPVKWVSVWGGMGGYGKSQGSSSEIGECVGEVHVREITHGLIICTIRYIHTALAILRML